MSPPCGPGGLTPAAAGLGLAWSVEHHAGPVELPYGLATTPAVRELLERHFAKRLGLSTVRLHLQRWGFTPQRPLVRAKERQPAAIAAWLANTYPAIAKRARAMHAMIYWGDETGISNQDPIGRSYAPK